MNLLMVGCGNMGQALLTKWLESDALSHITIISPSGKPQYENHKKITVYNNPDAIADSTLFDGIILAVKPQVMGEILPYYKRFATTNTPDTSPLFITIAAGKSIDFYQDILGHVPLVRLMPNTPSSIGQGICLMVGNTKVKDVHYKNIHALLQHNGTVEHLDTEEQLDKATLLSSCGPAYVALFLECLCQGGEHLGLDTALSKRLALQTLIGSTEMIASTPLPFATQRQNVTSKGGVTEAVLDVLGNPETGLPHSLIQGLNNAIQRTKDLQGDSK